MTGPHLVIDDHLLLRVLLGDEPARLRPGGAELSTTGLWYHRLCRALAHTSVSGALSRTLGQVDEHVARRAVQAVVELPADIGCTSLRSLGWPMAELVADGATLNLLSLEALAVAQHLGAELCLARADDNPTLRAEAKRRRVPLRLVA